MLHSACYKSPIGLIEISADDDAVRGARFVDGLLPCGKPNSLLTDALEQMDSYFKGKIRAFNLPLEPEGTDFQQQVWLALRHIPFGHKRTYGEVADAAGNAKAARAVGQACNKNPLPIFIPCHRVLGVSNPLDYACGHERKAWLLKHEGISF